MIFGRQGQILRGVTVHALRHSYATHFIDGSADVRIVQEQLGHASPESTMIYTHITQQESRKALLTFQRQTIALTILPAMGTSCRPLGLCCSLRSLIS